MSDICQLDTLSPQSPISDICQLDGIDDIVPHVSPAPHQIPGAGPGPSANLPLQTGNVKTAPYSLNRKKQVSKLVTDASNQDYVINVSPTEQNVNVECSTGFYSLVVLPAFSAIFVGFSTTAANTGIQCYDITNKVDNSKSHVNTVLFFKLNTPNTSRSNNVTITLHHTVRKVQVQGSSNINGNIRANVWFLQNVLLDMFSSLSATKAMDISKFNIMVQNVVTNHINKRKNESKCNACDIPFTNRSQLELCQACNNHYHRKCIPSHLCVAADVFQPSSNNGTTTGPSTGQPHSLSVTTSAHSSTSTPISSSQPVPKNTVSVLRDTDESIHLSPPIHHAQPAHHIPTYPADSDLYLCHTHPGSSNQATHQADQGLQPHQSGILHLQHDDQGLLSHNPRSLNHEHTSDTLASAVQGDVMPTTIVGTSTAQPQRPAAKNNKKGTTKHVPPSNNASFEIECQQKQIAVAQAKIQELEAENVKLNKTNHILGERIKMFENIQEKEMFDTYFPPRPAPVPPPTKTTSHPVSSSQCQTHHSCCSPPPCHAHHHCTQRGHDTGVMSDIVEKLNNLLASVNGLNANIATLPRSRPEQHQQPPHSATIEGLTMQPLSPVITVVNETSEDQHTQCDPARNSPTLHNISTSSSNTIEDHVEVVDNMNLNSTVLTSRFPQLMQHSPT